MVDADVIGFALVATLTLAFALLTVFTHRLFASALFLAGTLLGVAGLFLYLNAQFLFVIQILVYVGAIVTLILFAIMFTHGSTQEEGSP
ncbi:MAG: NADH-quinone oxidoreductase subunit J [Euryarchaeota archaeon]|nr:NADH-quinone oxidoreductase subunit J [Euryarchaeota archaeon]